MSKDFLLKVATVLETAADVIDAQEAEKVASANAARNEAVKAVAAKYASLMGEDLPEEELSKLASGDALSTFTRLLEKTASGPVESLGRSSDHPSVRPAPTTKKEAAQNAWDRFGDFLNS